MHRSPAVSIAFVAALCLCDAPALGHNNCGHHGGCAASYSRDCGHHGRGPCFSGSRSFSAPLSPEQQTSRIGPAIVESHKGKILDVIYSPGLTPDSAVVELRLSNDDTPVLVRLGPAGFLKQNQLHLREGDTITVTGYRVTTGADDLLVAIELTKQGKTVRFRDSWGRPAW